METPDIAALRKFRPGPEHWDTRSRHEIKPQVDVLEFRPFHEDRVLIKRLEPLADMSRAVCIPDAKGRAEVGIQRGLVIACAPGVDEVQPGDVVLYARWPANEFEPKKQRREFGDEGELYCFVYEEQSIMAIEHPHEEA